MSTVTGYALWTVVAIIVSVNALMHSTNLSTAEGKMRHTKGLRNISSLEYGTKYKPHKEKI